MAYLTVTTLADLIDPSDGRLSLREAIAQANGTGAADTIRFRADLEGGALVLTQGQLTITQDLTIDGDRDDNGSAVTIDGNASDRVLNVSGDKVDVNLSDLTIANGRTLSGGAGGILFSSTGHLTLTGCTVRDNDGSNGDGGGIRIDGFGSRLTISDSRVIDNYDSYGGGGIDFNGASAVIRRSVISGNSSYEAGGGLDMSGSLLMEDSTVSGNSNFENSGGGLELFGPATIVRSTIAGNSTAQGGGIFASGSRLILTDSTVAANRATGDYGRSGAGISAVRTQLVIRNSTITGNVADDGPARPGEGGGIRLQLSTLDISNSIVAGNSVGSGGTGPDLFGGPLAFSNGHNIFGSSVDGAIAGDRQNAPAGEVFATIDPATGGGLLNPNGVVSLRNDVANPALTGADPLVASAVGQLGTSPRPQPSSSLPDIGSIEINQPLSTGPTPNNDVITGSGGGNTLSGFDGNDLLRGLGGPDILNAGNGSDLLDGGPGNNTLNGGTGFDLASFAFSDVRVVVDLGGTADTARRGGETDVLTSIEGAIGTVRGDRFIGDADVNAFQGGRGRDLATGGGARDTYFFATIQDSPPGSSRSDLVTDFAPGQDVLDLTRIDADPGRPGDQPFVWRGTAAFTGAPGEVRYVRGSTTIVQANTDGDLAPELEIRLTGNKALTEGDLRL